MPHARSDRVFARGSTSRSRPLLATPGDIRPFGVSQGLKFLSSMSSLRWSALDDDRGTVLDRKIH